LWLTGKVPSILESEKPNGEVSLSNKRGLSKKLFKTIKMERLIPSTDPIGDIERVSYPGQHPKKKMYRAGYEEYFAMMPVLNDDDKFLDLRIRITKSLVQHLSTKIQSESWVKDADLKANEFERTIIGMEEPELVDGKLKEGTELVVANWGDGHSSPIHGHAAGYLHEEILFGKMRVNTYRKVDNGFVRPLMTEIVKQGTFAAVYSTKESNKGRNVLVHNFTSIGHSATLHYLPEHTRDGRDNKFEVERFNERFGLTKEDVTQLTGQEAMYLQPGEVMLVRSSNVPEYGDHYVVITGHPVMKEHGLRPQDMSIFAPDGTEFLDQFEMKTGVTLLKLSKKATAFFHAFHDIRMVDGQVVIHTEKEEVLNL
jgi:hypothetical protein